MFVDCTDLTHLKQKSSVSVWCEERILSTDNILRQILSAEATDTEKLLYSYGSQYGVGVQAAGVEALGGCAGCALHYE